MRHAAHRLLCQLGLSGLLLLAGQGQGQAGVITGADAVAMRLTVQAQLDAFARDDAATAFSLATAATRDVLRYPQLFLEMVRQRYPAVYRNRLALFSDPEMIAGHALLTVRLTDRDDMVWIAVYAMVREGDGSWKIETCSLIEADSVSV